MFLEIKRKLQLIILIASNLCRFKILQKYSLFYLLMALEVFSAERILDKTILHHSIQ